MTGHGLGFRRFLVDTLITGLQADRTDHFTPSEDQLCRASEAQARAAFLRLIVRPRHLRSR
jgi:hypothetical protein